MARVYIIMLDDTGRWSGRGDTVVPATRSPSIGMQASIHKDSFKHNVKHKLWSRYAVYRGAILDIPDTFEVSTPIYDLDTGANI